MARKKAAVLKDQIADILRREIYLGNINDGEKLRQEDISQKLGVSRMPVREAFLQLESEGILVRLQNRHIIVVGMTQTRIRQNLEALCAIEIAMSVNHPDIGSLKEAMKVYKSMSTGLDLADWVDAIIDLHTSISKALDNPYLYQLHNRMVEGYPRFLYEHKAFNRGQLFNLHEDMINAVVDGNSMNIRIAFEAYYEYIAQKALEE